MDFRKFNDNFRDYIIIKVSKKVISSNDDIYEKIKYVNEPFNIVKNIKTVIVSTNNTITQVYDNVEWETTKSGKNVQFSLNKQNDHNNNYQELIGKKLPLQLSYRAKHIISKLVFSNICKEEFIDYLIKYKKVSEKIAEKIYSLIKQKKLSYIDLEGCTIKFESNDGKLELDICGVLLDLIIHIFKSSIPLIFSIVILGCVSNETMLVTMLTNVFSFFGLFNSSILRNISDIKIKTENEIDIDIGTVKEICLITSEYLKKDVKAYIN